jgi:hypothetical protein
MHISNPIPRPANDQLPYMATVDRFADKQWRIEDTSLKISNFTRILFPLFTHININM